METADPLRDSHSNLADSLLSDKRMLTKYIIIVQHMRTQLCACILWCRFDISILYDTLKQVSCNGIYSLHFTKENAFYQTHYSCYFSNPQFYNDIIKWYGHGNVVFYCTGSVELPMRMKHRKLIITVWYGYKDWKVKHLLSHFSYQNGWKPSRQWCMWSSERPRISARVKGKFPQWYNTEKCCHCLSICWKLGTAFSREIIF